MKRRLWLIGCISFSLWLCLIACVMVGLLAVYDNTRWNDQLASAQAGKDSHLKLEVNGETRTYLLHLPPQYVGTTPLPLILLLHGGGGNAEQLARSSKMNNLADSEGFILAYPNGSSRLPVNQFLTWNAGGCCAYAMENQVDDLAFMRALIDELSTTLAVDPERVYMAGISNGGMMSMAAACELSDRLTGIATQVGALMWEDCNPSKPIEVLMINGQEDEVVLYNGGVSGVGRVSFDAPSTQETIQFWAEQNACNLTPESITNPEGNVITETYTDCAENVRVRLITVTDGGHGWYGAEKSRLRGDDPSDAISTNEEIWRFFSGE